MNADVADKSKLRKRIRVMTGLTLTAIFALCTIVAYAGNGVIRGRSLEESPEVCANLADWEKDGGNFSACMADDQGVFAHLKLYTVSYRNRALHCRPLLLVCRSRDHLR